MRMSITLVALAAFEYIIELKGDLSTDITGVAVFLVFVALAQDIAYCFKGLK